MKGFIQIYTGDGKGKTTAALGLAMRAVGHGLKIAFIQFMKKWEYGELKSARKLGIEIRQFGIRKFVKKGRPPKKAFEEAEEGMKFAKSVVMSGKYDIVVLDEINTAVDFGLVQKSEALKLIEERPEHVELVLTGRGAPDEFIKIADLVTEMREVKHPFRKGVMARRGIEY